MTTHWHDLFRIDNKLEILDESGNRDKTFEDGKYYNSKIILIKAHTTKNDRWPRRGGDVYEKK